MKKIIIIFVVLAIIALCLVLSKGHIGKWSLVYTEPVPDRVLEIGLDKLFISSVSKEKIKPTITLDGEEVKEGYKLFSSDENIAQINENNEIVAVSNGKVTITAKYDIAEAEIDLKVITPIKSSTFTTTNSTVRVGKDLQLKLKTDPLGASIDPLTYISSDEEIATVNANGIVTGVSEGKVTITVRDEYSGIEKTVNLSIKK